MLRYLSANLHTNLRGKFFKDKIIIFESDDWGSIRISSLDEQKYLISKGIDFGEDQYTQYDGLEKNADIDILGETLLSFRNADGNCPTFTLNIVTGNPDFELIKSCSFSEYFIEPASKTYENYADSHLVLSKIKLGIKEKIFLPQFHSREHVNVELWMHLLRANNKFFRTAFDCGIFALGIKYTKDFGKHIAATYDILDRQYVETSIIEGADFFNQLFGYRSTTFIPNNFVWNPIWNDILKRAGIEHIQGMKYILLPKSSPNQNRSHYRLYNGKMSEFGQSYAVRNCSFEPLDANYSLQKSLYEIKLAFLLGKPAIISTHRVNYTSRICQDTRDRNIVELKKLIKEILNKWPDVKFLSTVELLPYLNER